MGTASFGTVIVPLAARGSKAGTRWIDTDDITLINNGKWYASYDTLEAAR